MKRMKALGVVEWHLTSRQAIYYLLSIGMPISLFPEWMQAIGKCLPTYQLMELIKTFLNKGQVNGFASLYLALFTLVLFALVIVYRRHSEVRS